MCLFTQWTEPGMPIKIQCRRALLREREKGKFPQARGSSPPFFERLKFKEVVLSSIHECCGWREKRRRRRDLKKSSLANKLWIFNLEILIKLPRQSLFFTTTASIPAACSSFLSLALSLRTPTALVNVEICVPFSYFVSASSHVQYVLCFKKIRYLLGVEQLAFFKSSVIGSLRLKISAPNFQRSLVEGLDCNGWSS